MASQVEQFGKYLLLEKLAAGGMAEVYLSKTAGAVGVNKFVAIKRILPQYSGNQEFIEMFKEEAKICVNLNHGNVVSIFDFGIEHESFFLVMEFVPGKNLRQIINELKKLNKSFTTEQIVFIVKEVAAGLDHAHRCVDSATGRPLNITHRDMSPQNVMVSFEGEIKVIDFGIAKAETQLEATKAGTLKGKFGYMSPEQAEGFPIDPRTDVFALGIVLWELLANDRLFTASNEAAILRKIRDCQIPPIRKINPAVPPELERIVNKALAKDKNLRYQTAANFHRDLNRFLNTQYPDFSPHDFSVFIKDCFSQHYIDQRNKLVEFAKIQFNEEKNSGHGNATNTSVTQANTSPDIPNNRKTLVDLTQHDFDNDDDESEQLDINTKGSHKVSLEGIRDQSAAPKNLPSKTLIKKTQTVNPHTQFGPAATRTNIPNVNTGMTRPTISGLPQAPKANSALDSITDLLTKGVVSILLVLGGYYVFKTSGLQKQTECYLKTNSFCKEQQPYVADPASTVKFGYTIYSDSGDVPNLADSAQIFIDGIDSKYTTPSRITVPGNRPLLIRIVKEGFVDFEKSVTVTAEGQSLVATMQKERRTVTQPNPTTITVTLEKSTGGEQIFINGVRLQNERLPLTRYTVQPNTDIVIKVVNPYTNQVDQQTVILQPGENKLIDFDFSRVRQ